MNFSAKILEERNVRKDRALPKCGIFLKISIHPEDIAERDIPSLFGELELPRKTI